VGKVREIGRQQLKPRETRSFARVSLLPAGVRRLEDVLCMVGEKLRSMTGWFSVQPKLLQSFENPFGLDRSYLVP
jgi:hypothetical protein